MRKFIVVCVALLSSLAFASLATATKPDHPSKPDKPAHPVKAKDGAAKQCAAAKRADKAAFRSLYGKHAMRTCIKGEKDDSKAELKNAAKECKAAQAGDPDGFADAYGTGKNAYGKCVSSTVKAEDAEDVSEFKNAAKECKALRSEDPASFEETYGRGKKGRNALGKCVSAKAHESEQETPPAS